MSRTPPPATWSIAVVSAVVVAAAGLVPQARAEGRARMVDTSAEIGAADCVKTAAQAVCDEDLDAYLGCFTSDQRSKLRRKVAILFVSHTLDLDLVDSHVVSETAAKTELAVKYRVTLSEETYDIVSIIDLVKEDGSWRIAREQVETRRQVGGSGSCGTCGDQVVRFGGGCANGRCGL